MHRHRQLAEQIVRELRIGELEVTFVVELKQGRRKRMIVLQVQIMDLRFAGRVAAFLANVHLKRPRRREAS